MRGSSSSPSRQLTILPSQAELPFHPALAPLVGRALPLSLPNRTIMEQKQRKPYGEDTLPAPLLPAHTFLHSTRRHHHSILSPTMYVIQSGLSLQPRGILSTPGMCHPLANTFHFAPSLYLQSPHPTVVPLGVGLLEPRASCLLGQVSRKPVFQE